MLATVWLDVNFRAALFGRDFETILKPVGRRACRVWIGVIQRLQAFSLLAAIVLSGLLGVVAWRLGFGRRPKRYGRRLGSLHTGCSIL